MALVLKDRVKETSTTTGTGTFTLAGAASGFQSFSVIGNSNTTYYAIDGGAEWEVGIGTYSSTGTTLSRDTILSSSNGGTAVNFSAGTKNVFVTYPAGKGIYTDDSGNAIALGTPASATLTNATGLPISTGISGLGTGVATFLTTPTSANLASAVTNETGSGSLVFATLPTFDTTGVKFSGSTSGTTTVLSGAVAGTSVLTLPVATDTLVGKATTDTLTNKTLTSPSLTTPVLGTPSSGTLTSCTGLPLTTGVTGTLPVGNGGTGITTTPSNGQIPIGNGTNYTAATLTAGTGISVTNASGSITIANTAPSASWQSVQTSGFTAVAGNGYPCNTTSAAFTVTLPASPSAGNAITLSDYAGTWQTNNLTVNPNGNKINGSTTNATFFTRRQSISLVYIDATQGWIPYSGFVGTTNIQAYTATYLIVAGGGGASGCQSVNTSSGGGGAGGLITSTVSLTPNTVYTAVVGGGGTGRSGYSTVGGSGTDSSFTGLTTAVGGGGSGSYGCAPTGGGSGGAPGSYAVGNGTVGSGTSGQGNAGGAGALYTGSATYAGGGGGGSGSVGSASSAGTGGNGGSGTSSSITGSAVTYASGGGGGGITTAGTSQTGGNGGKTANGSNGTANTGGGGGGCAGNATFVGGNGGSGVVILSVPTINYSGTVTGSPTVTTSGANTIISWTTGSGTYTA